MPHRRRQHPLASAPEKVLTRRMPLLFLAFLSRANAARNLVQKGACIGFRLPPASFRIEMPMASKDICLASPVALRRRHRCDAREITAAPCRRLLGIGNAADRSNACWSRCNSTISDAHSIRRLGDPCRPAFANRFVNANRPPPTAAKPGTQLECEQPGLALPDRSASAGPRPPSCGPRGRARWDRPTWLASLLLDFLERPGRLVDRADDQRYAEVTRHDSSPFGRCHSVRC